MPTDYGGLFRSETNRAIGAGRTAEREYRNRLHNFDPMEGLRTSSQGAWESIAERLREEIGDLRGSQVGVGRLQTGFATGDEDRLFAGGVRNLNQRIAQGAMGAQHLDFARIQELGGYAGSRYAQGLEMLMSERERQDARRQNRASGVGAALGTAAGIGLSFIPGAQPFAGSLIAGGGQVGAGIGSLFG